MPLAINTHTSRSYREQKPAYWVLATWTQPDPTESRNQHTGCLLPEPSLILQRAETSILGACYMNPAWSYREQKPAYWVLATWTQPDPTERRNQHSGCLLPEPSLILQRAETSILGACYPNPAWSYREQKPAYWALATWTQPDPTESRNQHTGHLLPEPSLILQRAETSILGACYLNPAWSYREQKPAYWALATWTQPDPTESRNQHTGRLLPEPSLILQRAETSILGACYLNPAWSYREQKPAYWALATWTQPDPTESRNQHTGRLLPEPSLILQRAETSILVACYLNPAWSYREQKPAYWVLATWT